MNYTYVYVFVFFRLKHSYFCLSLRFLQYFSKIPDIICLFYHFYVKWYFPFHPELIVLSFPPCSELLHVQRLCSELFQHIESIIITGTFFIMKRDDLWKETQSGFPFPISEDCHCICVIFSRKLFKILFQLLIVDINTYSNKLVIHVRTGTGLRF